MNKFNIAQKLAREYAKKIKDTDVISIVQIGSSLRKEDFTPDSDLDFLVIYKKTVKDFLRHDKIGDFEVNIIQHGKNQFVKSLKEGNSVDLIALKFGKVLYDNGFFKQQRDRVYKPTQKTVDKWLHTASFNLGDASINYTLPTCMCCYFKSLQHAAREFCRAIIVKEHNEIIEGNNNIVNRLRDKYPKICKNFDLIINGRKSYKNFDSKLIKSRFIKNSGLGKYLLAAEEIAIEAFRICKDLDMSKVNDLISRLTKKYQIEYFHSFHLIPESKQILINMILKRNKVAIFIYNIEDKTLRKLKKPT